MELSELWCHMVLLVLFHVSQSCVKIRVCPAFHIILRLDEIPATVAVVFSSWRAYLPRADFDKVVPLVQTQLRWEARGRRTFWAVGSLSDSLPSSTTLLIEALVEKLVKQWLGFACSEARLLGRHEVR